LELVIGVLRISLASLVDDLWMLWDKQKQTLHDKIASTIVVKAGVTDPPQTPR